MPSYVTTLTCPDCDGNKTVLDRYDGSPDTAETCCESCDGVGDWYICPCCEDFVGQDRDLSALHVERVRRKFDRALDDGDNATATRCRKWLADYEHIEANGQCMACERADQALADERAEDDAISMSAELTTARYACTCRVCGRACREDEPLVQFGRAALCVPCAEGASAALTLAAVKGVAA